MMNHHQLLTELNEAAKSKDTYKCELIIRDLLTLLDPRDVLQIALDQIGFYLPIFESYHPEKIWVRQWFELALKLEPIDYSSHAFGMYEDYEELTSKAFMNAIQLCDTDLRAYFKQMPMSFVNLAASIANIQSARMIEYFNVKDPSFWQIYERLSMQPDEFSHQEQNQIGMAFREHPARAEFIENSMKEISNVIAQKFL